MSQENNLENALFPAEKEENKINDNTKNTGKIKKSKTLRSSLKMKKKEKKHHRNSSCDAIITGKKVKINSKVEIIDVESWKKYNLEQTADENFEEFLKMEYENEKKEKENKNNPNNDNNNNNNKVKRIKGRNGNVSCTCIII